MTEQEAIREVQCKAQAQKDKRFDDLLWALEWALPWAEAGLSMTTGKDDTWKADLEKAQAALNSTCFMREVAEAFRRFPDTQEETPCICDPLYSATNESCPACFAKPAAPREVKRCSACGIVMVPGEHWLSVTHITHSTMPCMGGTWGPVVAEGGAEG